MAAFEWREKESPHFGRVWVPVIVAEFQAVSGTFTKLHMVVDSGAIATFVRRSFAEELGIELDSGRPVRLANAAGGYSEAFVHELAIRLDRDEPAFKVPVAIATRENVPNLLGRLGVFDRRRITFEPLSRRTLIESPNE
ncbi:MAG TPA: retropepsin-like aspartic protease [Phycisphaerae bacterium]|nr:retropepsin-like aspartic protease [Phycisphaerae bacterium]